MSGGKNHRVRCVNCGGHESEVGPISWGGNCASCGNARMLANAAAMRTHRGEAFDHWRRRTLAAFGIHE